MEYKSGEGYSIEKLIQFGNEVFGEEVFPGGFDCLLPKLKKTPLLPQHFRLIEEEGELKAMLLSLPLTLKVWEAELSVRYVGLVAVDKSSRGKGYMSTLMTQAITEMEKEQTMLSILGGQRQRYEYFGYEPGGLEYRCRLNKTNVRHSLLGKDTKDNITIEELKKESTELKQAYALFQQQPARVQREEDSFYELLKSWRSIPYTIYKEGEFYGYLSISKERETGKVLEMYLKDTMVSMDVIFARCMEVLNLEKLEFAFSYQEMMEHQELENLCETYEIGTNHSIRVFDFLPLLSAYLTQKSKLERLKEGECCFFIEREYYKVTVKDGVPNVTKEEMMCKDDKTKEQNDTTKEQNLIPMYTRKEAMQQFFSPLSYLPRKDQKKEGLGLFPLPLYLSLLDAC